MYFYSPITYRLFLSVILEIGLIHTHWFPSVSTAQGLSQKTLIVATRQAPPFSIRTSEGKWQGISIDLWKEIAGRLELKYEFREMEIQEMLEALQKQSADLAVAALTVTADREKDVDFTHPFYNSGLGIAVLQSEGSLLTGVFERVLSFAFLEAVSALGAVLLLAGTLVWFFERRRNVDQFGGGAAKGLGSGFWWAAVTMTTVGYGDKAPKTLGGRSVALIWMYASVIVISSFTAMIATALTVGELRSRVHGPEDLPNLLVGTVGGSTSETYLQKNFILSRLYNTVPDALQGLANGEIEAVVYDAPLLGYYVNQHLPFTVRVLPRVFERQNYAIALPNNCPLRESINQVLLDQIGQDSWQGTLQRYLGTQYAN